MLRILAVDDDRVVQRYLIALLSPHGLVDLAGNGVEAVDMARRSGDVVKGLIIPSSGCANMLKSFT